MLPTPPKTKPFSFFRTPKTHKLIETCVEFTQDETFLGNFHMETKKSSPMGSFLSSSNHNHGLRIQVNLIGGLVWPQNTQVDRIQCPS